MRWGIIGMGYMAKKFANSLLKLKSLPPATKIYFGHEYTLNNSIFCSKFDEDNSKLDRKIIDIKKSDILFKEKKIFFSIKKRTNNPGSNLGFAENLERQYKCKLSIFCIWFERGI